MLLSSTSAVPQWFSCSFGSHALLSDFCFITLQSHHPRLQSLKVFWKESYRKCFRTNSNKNHILSFKDVSSLLPRELPDFCIAALHSSFHTNSSTIFMALVFCTGLYILWTPWRRRSVFCSCRSKRTWNSTSIKRNRCLQTFIISALNDLVVSSSNFYLPATIWAHSPILKEKTSHCQRCYSFEMHLEEKTM